MQAGADTPREEELIRMARPELRAVNEGQFTPLFVPIGPYHHAREGLSQLAEEKKTRAADKVLPPGYRKRPRTMDALNALAVKARACYPDLSNRNSTLRDDSGKFVQMLLVDKARACYPDLAISRDSTLRDDSGKFVQMLLVDKARACYPDLAVSRDSTLQNDSQEFVQMLLRDGCYVLSFLVDYKSASEGSDGHTQEAGSGRAVMREENWVMRDTLFLLENQIPWFVLKKLHHCIVGNEDRSVLDDLSLCVRLLLKDRLHISGRQRLPSDANPSTLLHLVHAYFMPTTDHLALDVPREVPPPGNTAAPVVVPRVPLPRRRMDRWRRAAEYCRYGNVKLKRREWKDREADSVLDVDLQGRTLWMPCLLIDSTTWTILRNLMALEERMDRRPVTAYCVFMSQLACKVEDVELLQRAGIVQHFLGNDDELLQGFAALCKEVVLDVDSPDENYLNRTWHQLHERCQSKRNNFYGFFREIHGASYVHIFAFVGAVLLFLFQLAQVILTGFSLRKTN